MTRAAIDSDVANDDETTATATAGQLRENLSEHMDRPIAGQHAYSIRMSKTLLPVVSTHPDYWMGFCFLVPPCIGATALKAAIAYRLTNTATADVRVKLRWAQNGGASVTLAHPQTTTDLSATMSVNPRADRGRWSLVQLLFQSDVAATPDFTNVDLYGVINGGTFLVTPGSAITEGRKNWLYEIDTSAGAGALDTQRVRFYVGRSTDAAVAANHDDEFDVWPYPTEPLRLARNTDPAKLDSGDVSELGTVELHGVAFWFGGDSGQRDMDGGAYAGGAVLTAGHVNNLHNRFTQLASDRARWLPCGPQPEETPRYHGVVVAAGVTTTVGYAYLDHRGDFDGFEFAIAWLPMSGTETASRTTEITLAVDIQTVDGVSTDSASRIVSAALSPAMTRPEDGGSLALFNVTGNEPSLWGMGDLQIENEQRLLSVDTVKVDYPSTAGSWYSVRLRVTSSTGPIYVATVSGRELFNG